jgi:uncharacterized protein YegP (UPF0339 family)
MPHKFKIVSAKGGQFRVQFGYNGEVMLWTENYASKGSAENAIESLKKNAPKASVVDMTKGEDGKGYRFEMVASKDGQTFVRFVAQNGETMYRSETYKSKASARNCIASTQKNGPGAATLDETEKA